MRLIRRQSELIRYLLNPDAFRSEAAGEGLPPGLEGLDSERLGVLGLFSLAKRREKINSILPKTSSYLRGNTFYNFADFAVRYPQHDATYLANGTQYFDYLLSIWKETTPDPLWLPDVAQYEIEYAIARAGQIKQEEPIPDSQSYRRCIRRHRRTRLSRYDYDIREILGDPENKLTPEQRDIRLAIITEISAQDVKVYELTPQIYNVLAGLDSWSPIEKLKIEGANNTRQMIEQLELLSLIEVCI